MRAKTLLLIGLGLLLNTGVRAQQADDQTDAEKKRQFLKAKEEMRTIPPTPSTDQMPKPKPKPYRAATPPPEPTPKPKSEPEPTPKPKPEPTPKPKLNPEAFPQITPRPRPVTPAPVTPSPQITPQVIIEKTSEQGLVPPPAPVSRGWFSKPTYKYLTAGVRSAIDRANVARGRWRYIVVHNSGTKQGNAKAFDYYHKRVRKMQNGLAYHFVIGNGTSSGDGEVEIGGRWVRQINGGHVHSDYLNNIALGICLVGDFNRQVPTRNELESLEELIRYLRNRVGKIDGKPSIVKAHREINPPRWPTDCPGDRYPYGWLHSRFD
ncbi:MAG: peptidoglycan recognition family protein [Chthoniobacteraceae bacterium]